MSTLDRRSFLTRGAAAAGTAAVSTTLFQTLNNAAGASRSALGHHGEVLFVNIQGNGTTVPGSGMTCAITGPWRRGAL
jgi:hypothetical protein